MNTFIKLMHTVDLTFKTDQINAKHDHITIFHTGYSENLKAYFIRARNSVALFINSNQKISDQSKCIKIIEQKIIKCGFVDIGLIDSNFNYKCGTKCWEKNKNNICTALL